MRAAMPNAQIAFRGGNRRLMACFSADLSLRNLIESMRRLEFRRKGRDHSIRPEGEVQQSTNRSTPRHGLTACRVAGLAGEPHPLPPLLKKRAGGDWPGARHCGEIGMIVFGQSTWNFQRGVPEMASIA